MPEQKEGHSRIKCRALSLIMCNVNHSPVSVHAMTLNSVPRGSGLRRMKERNGNPPYFDFVIVGFHERIVIQDLAEGSSYSLSVCIVEAVDQSPATIPWVSVVLSFKCIGDILDELLGSVPRHDIRKIDVRKLLQYAVR